MHPANAVRHQKRKCRSLGGSRKPVLHGHHAPGDSIKPFGKQLLWYAARVVTHPVCQNSGILALLAARRYQRDDIDRIENQLQRWGTLTMRPLASGLFPAAATATSVSGYGNVWVRDNIHVAYAHHLQGKSEVAALTVRVIFEFFWKHRQRFDAIIAGEADPNDAMLRPHVRFDGESLTELAHEPWPHAQNDALGYALWLCSLLLTAGTLKLDRPVVEMLRRFPRYFEAIRYWEDEDSGHWEETRKRSASSIGTVVAGLEALVALARDPAGALRTAGFDPSIIELASGLAHQGRVALLGILPRECVQLSLRKNRRYDAALLFLVHPLNVVAAPLADLIIADVDRYLSGPHGIRRYLGDSYWAPDYDQRMPEQELTRDYSNDVAMRDTLLERIGDEAQWCIFDPVLSAYFGRCYRETRGQEYLDRQVHHFERALAQITADWRCPELYYSKQGTYVPNPHTPLLWTQANLLTALSAMKASSVVANPANA